MTNPLRSLYRSRPSITILACLIFAVLGTGFLISATVWIYTSRKLGLFDQPICFSNVCVKDYLERIDQSLLIFKATLDLSVAIATIGGIFVALLSYFSTTSNAALTNHIEHLKVFCEYVESEIKKRDRLRSAQIDSLLLYSTIFSQSRDGKTTVSEDYKTLMIQLNDLIKESNGRSVIGTPGGFSYRDHQRKVRDQLEPAGILVYLAPRNDYFEMEAQLFSLIQRISQSFCPPGVLIKLEERQYY